MKSLNAYIFEKIKPLPQGSTGIIVFDIDDTLLKVNPDSIHIYKRNPDGTETALTTAEYAVDPDASIFSSKKLFDYREFEDPIKVYDSIITGTPLMKNIRILDDYIKADYDFCFLTARGCEDVIKDAIEEFLKKVGIQAGEAFKKTFSAAVGDMVKKYPGNSDAEKKANVLRNLCAHYDNVVFIDDDHKNIRIAKGLHLRNLKIIKAWN